MNKLSAIKISKNLVQFIFCILLTHTQIVLATILPNNQAIYRIKYDGVTIGTSTVTLKTTASNLYLLSITDQPSIPFLSGYVLESSSGIWSGKLSLPLHYFYNYHYLTKRRQIDLSFNWRDKKVITRMNGLPWTMPISIGTQDKLSYELQLRQDLLNNKNTFSYPVADGGKIKYYQFKIIGHEIITTPLGTFNTIKITRLPMPEKENLTLWIAKQLNYQIVRIEQTKHIMDYGIAEIISYRQI